MRGIVFPGHRKATVHRWEKSSNPELRAKAKEWREILGMPPKEDVTRVARSFPSSVQGTGTLTSMLSTRQMAALARATGRSVREVSIEMT